MRMCCSCDLTRGDLGGKVICVGQQRDKSCALRTGYGRMSYAEQHVLVLYKEWKDCLTTTQRSEDIHSRAILLVDERISTRTPSPSIHISILPLDSLPELLRKRQLI